MQTDLRHAFDEVREQAVDLGRFLQAQRASARSGYLQAAITDAEREADAVPDRLHHYHASVSGLEEAFSTLADSRRRLLEQQTKVEGSIASLRLEKVSPELRSLLEAKLSRMRDSNDLVRSLEPDLSTATLFLGQTLSLTTAVLLKSARAVLSQRPGHFDFKAAVGAIIFAAVEKLTELNLEAMGLGGASSYIPSAISLVLELGDKFETAPKLREHADSYLEYLESLVSAARHCFRSFDEATLLNRNTIAALTA